ncbi:reverse transcriptase domain-containing protein [Tanacetum coccineum]
MDFVRFALQELESTMSELLQAPTEGYGDAICIPAILAENFELKVGLLTLFVNYFFPPSKTMNLKNDITNFQQRFDETFSKAWDRFKDLLHKCPQHDFSELHQIDTFYNALTQSDQNSLNAAADVSANTSSSTPAYLLEITALTDAIKAMLIQNKTPSPAHVKAMEEIYVTCGGPHPYYECLATDGNTFNASAATGTYNQGEQSEQTNDANMRAMKNQISTMKTELKNEIQSTLMNQNNELKNMMSSFVQMHSPTGSESLPSNTIANPRGDLKVITTRSGVSYDGPTIPPTYSPLPKEVEREPEATKDKVQTTSLRSTTHVQPLVVQVSIPELDVAPKPNPKPSIPYPSRLNDQKL